MTRITEIEDRGAAVAWSPEDSLADVIALGTKVCNHVCFISLFVRWRENECL